MSSSKITLTGFTEWMEAENDDLWAAFDDLPTGIDKDTLVQNILLRGGEFEVIYSNPYFMQEAMVPWVTKWSRTIEKWITALAIEYDPLSNYDRTEQWTDTGTGTRSGSGSTAEQNTVLNNESMSSTNGETNSSTNEETNSSTNAETASHVKDGTSSVGTKTDGSDVTSGNTVNEVSAFDAGTYQPHDQSIAANSTVTTSDTSTNTVNGETGSDVSSAETNETRAANASETRTANASETRNGLTNADRSITNSNSENSATNDIHYGRIFGNIGVTTSQQMLQSELDIAMFNLYDRVTDLFLAEFIIPIYY